MEILQDKKKIAIVVCAWPPNGGGIGNNAYYQAIKLSQVGYSVGVFTLDFLGIDKSQTGFILKPLKGIFKIGKAGWLWGLWKNLSDYQIIHLYSPFFGSDLSVVLFKLFHPRVKLLVHYHMDPLESGLKGLIFWLYVKIFWPIIFNISDLIVVLSYDHAENSYIKKIIKKHPEKFFELPNGVDANLFFPGDKNPTLKSQYSLNPYDKLILFVGGLGKQHYFKGVPELLRAFKMIDINFFPDIIEEGSVKGVLNEFRGEAKLLIIGDGVFRQDYQKFAEELGVADRVFFAGWVDNAKLPDYYRLADVVVLPSTVGIESFGIVLAEAQSCGVPVISSDWPGVRLTLENNKTGYLVKPGDENDLKEKLKKLLNDDKLRKEFGINGRLRVLEKYDWPVVIKLLDKIYNQFT